MSLRAPEPEPHGPDVLTAVLGHWEDSRWWRVLDEDGDLAMETSNPEEAQTFAREHYGTTLQRRRDFVPAECQWVDQEAGQ